MRHLSWKSRLKSFLDGQSSLTEAQATSPRDCDLGKWLYSTGLAKFGAMSCIKQLEKVHSEMHETVGKIIRLQNSGKKADAVQEFAKISPLSDKIIGLLNDAEQALKA